MREWNDQNSNVFFDDHPKLHAINFCRTFNTKISVNFVSKTNFYCQGHKLVSRIEPLILKQQKILQLQYNQHFYSFTYLNWRVKKQICRNY